MLQAIIFRIFPTALEISMVCGILVSKEPIQFSFLPATKIDMEIWLGFRCNHRHCSSCIHLVHRSHNFMEVSIIYLT
jgi:ABC-type transport system involved in Fe-S cluster assembly fused permease/ATPase subunit